MVGLVKILTEDVGLIPLSYRADVVAFRKGLTGPGTRNPISRGDTMDIQEWIWQ
jgi:hypothetical protein